MIKLKNGIVIDYNSDFDVFFKNLLKSIIQESKKSSHDKLKNMSTGDSNDEEFIKLKNAIQTKK